MSDIDLLARRQKLLREILQLLDMREKDEEYDRKYGLDGTPAIILHAALCQEQTARLCEMQRGLLGGGMGRAINDLERLKDWLGPQEVDILMDACKRIRSMAFFSSGA